MPNETPTRDYKSENELRKKALQKEEDFLKRDVMGQGAESTKDMGTQNIQSDIEQNIENSEGE